MHSHSSYIIPTELDWFFKVIDFKIYLIQTTLSKKQMKRSKTEVSLDTWSLFTLQENAWRMTSVSIAVAVNWITWLGMHTPLHSNSVSELRMQYTRRWRIPMIAVMVRFISLKRNSFSPISNWYRVQNKMDDDEICLLFGRLELHLFTLTRTNDDSDIINEG